MRYGVLSASFEPAPLPWLPLIGCVTNDSSARNQERRAAARNVGTAKPAVRAGIVALLIVRTLLSGTPRLAQTVDVQRAPLLRPPVSRSAPWTRAVAPGPLVGVAKIFINRIALYIERILLRDPTNANRTRGVGNRVGPGNKGFPSRTVSGLFSAPQLEQPGVSAPPAPHHHRWPSPLHPCERADPRRSGSRLSAESDGGLCRSKP
jgi:hypothetical protein